MAGERIPYSPRQELVKRARLMRSGPTKGEFILWQRLRNRQLNRFRFRCQHIINAYIVDFYCPTTRLVVEVDGEVHQYQPGYDQERDQIFISLGYRVPRFMARQVENQIGDVLANILAACKQTPSPTPSPLKGKG